MGKNEGLITFSHPHLCHTVKPDLFGETWLYIIACMCTCLCILVHLCMCSSVIYLYSKKHEITATISLLLFLMSIWLSSLPCGVTI